MQKGSETECNVSFAPCKGPTRARCNERTTCTLHAFIIYDLTPFCMFLTLDFIAATFIG